MSDEQQIRELVQTWMDATRAGDFKTVLGLMTDDVVFLVPGQPPMIGKAAFEASARPQGAAAPSFDGRADIQEIKVEGNWAVMWNRLSVTVTPPGGGAPKARSGHTLSVLRKQDGKWLLARDANLLQ